ncbi:hypothetical protein NIES2135_09770 [Leptolyngbya boryana NIES-2135]|jgi:hypothetical protein|uniref:Uncharacterized protein n=1 Tax=Leptolyngbya boryana NIES-2135 TaxID=1973484 RepID=A0A1Z4JBT6_LEPBY|nr:MULTISPECIES: sulfite exporter TauE/SafE family protein [Leptolyngbya]BAY54163.1 hypothetical protein NIES2135_09770 [Leptolyngbya boryana NIES-2135]MBD2371004.1 sulfite exporter TauE/SafE family protein [Leptolyngbya sp. FACHB-161]MBD2377538.1 sulfite exporter TauE/SafE family protein [Leptolyngbya sp. FACHB-238]MBD2401946.1 sulfite exporter TauE/SafE family protein [Leptolyngbya sp. FACHB-239]MBD2408464.1 sulfite exporter TauE/SafE family protein [Leptolyngbya sp. FACHB-402]
MSSIEIHQFCTALNPQGTRENWRSTGYRGGYMNSTLTKVPPAVDRDIRNLLFDVRPSKSEPALVGRECWGKSDAEEDWSVLAIVTLAQDESRSFPVYRYFLSQGRYNLSKLLAWVKSHDSYPVFDPFDRPSESIISNPQLESPEIPKWVDQHKSPIIVPPKHQMQVAAISAIAYQKSEKGKIIPAWAYNVEAIEKPERFLVIQPASQDTYQRLQNRTPVLEATAEVADEQGLKGALKALRDNRMNSKDLKTFVEALDDPNVSIQAWEQIFNSFDASVAIKKKIDTDEMIRLLTLRAIALPKELPNYLKWLNEGRKEESEKRTRTALTFQGQLELQSIPPRFVDIQTVRDRCYSGIEICFKRLQSDRTLVDRLVWVLSEQDSLWYKTQCNTELINNSVHDLRTLGGDTPPDPLPQLKSRDPDFWKSLHAEKRSGTYVPFAKLFKDLADKFAKIGSIRRTKSYYQLAAYFCQVTEGEVPKKIFKNALDSKRRKEKLWGRWISRKITVWEQAGYALIKIYDRFVFKHFYKIATIVGFLGGFILAIPNELKLIFIVFLGALTVVLLLMQILGRKFVKSVPPQDDPEQEMPKRQQIAMWVLSAFGFIIASAAGWGIGTLSNDRTLNNFARKAGSTNGSQTSNSTSSTPQPSGCAKIETQPPPELLVQARQSFSITRQEISRIVEKFKSNPPIQFEPNAKPQNQIMESLKCVLQSDVEYAGVIADPQVAESARNAPNQANPKIDKWIAALHNYQSRNGIAIKDGVLQLNGQTGQALEKALEDELKKKSIH